MEKKLYLCYTIFKINWFIDKNYFFISKYISVKEERSCIELSYKTAKVYSIEEIKNILDKILKDTPVKSVILFGSYAKNMADKNSDIDLIIDTSQALMGFKLFSLITKIEETFEKQVDAFEKSEIIENSKIDEEIKKTGVVVYEKTQ